ncbi:hypothetical protein AADX40_15180 [Aeromonas veronii]|uniref:hypothetical protein n=1 Tax=Aeromonas veronii TaxID=654 RepID=UPI003158E4AD
MKLSRGKPQIATQPEPEMAVYVQTMDGSYWDGQQFVWPRPDTEAGQFKDPYDALAFAMKAQSSPKMKHEEEDLRVVLRDKESQEEQLLVTADQSQLQPLLSQRWEKHLGTQFDQDALLAAQERIRSLSLPEFFLNGVPDHEKHGDAPPVSPLQRLIQENAATDPVVEDHHESDELPAQDTQQTAEKTIAAKAATASSIRPDRPVGFDKITAQRSFAGRLIDHGEAPYNHDKQEKPSYFVTYEHGGKQHTLWGKDLPNALADAGVDKGDYVQLDFLGSQPVNVLANVLDEKGQKVGEEWQTKHFNMWRGKEVDASYCATFTPKEKPFVKKDAGSSSQPQSGSKSGQKKPDNTPAPELSLQEQQQRMAPVPGGKAGSGIGAALGGMLSGLHRAGSSMASQLTGASKRDFSQRQSAEKHEQLLSAMTHSAARASAAATALACGKLAPVISEMKQRGVELDDVLNSDKHPDLKDRYGEVMEKHGGAVKAAMGELEWYATQAAESAKERGIDIQPEVDEAVDKVKEDAKDIALPDGQGKWTSISDTLDKVLEKVHELIRQIFARLTPGSSQA